MADLSIVGEQPIEQGQGVSKDLAIASEKPIDTSPSNWDVLKSGLKESTLGLLKKKLIDQQDYTPMTPAEQPQGFVQKAIHGVGQLAGDLPAYALYSMPGLLAGPAAPVAMPALAMGATETLKSGLRGEMPGKAYTAGAKGAAVGATMGATGGIATLPGAIAKTALPLTIAGGAAVSSGLEGQPVTAEDIAQMAIPLGLMHATVKGVAGTKAALEVSGKSRLSEIRQVAAEKAGIPQIVSETKMDTSGNLEPIANIAPIVMSTPIKDTTIITKEDNASKLTAKDIIEKAAADVADFQDISTPTPINTPELIARRRVSDQILQVKNEVKIPEDVKVETTPIEVAQVPERVNKLNTLPDDIRSLYKREVDQLGIDPDAAMHTFDALTPDKQLEHYNRMMNITPEMETPSPEVIEKAQDLRAQVEADAQVAINYKAQLAEQKKHYIQALLDAGKYTQEQLSKMKDASITEAYRKLNIKREDLSQMTPKEIDDMSDLESDLSRLNDKILADIEVTDEECQAVLAKALLTEPERIPSPFVFKETVDPDTGIANVTYIGVKQRRAAIRMELLRMMEERSKTAPLADRSTSGTKPTSVRRRPAKVEEPAKAQTDLERLVAEQEADRIAQENGVAVQGDMSIEDLRRQEEGGGIGNDTYDWSDRNMLKKNTNPIKTISQMSMDAALRLDDIMSKKTWTEGDGRDALTSVYNIKPNSASKQGWLDRVAEVEKRFAEQGTPHDRNRFNRRSLDLAEANKDITHTERLYIEKILSTLKRQPHFNLEYDPRLPDRNLGGTYNFARDLLRLGDPKSTAHEIMHYAWYNVLSGADRLAYAKYYADHFVTDSRDLNTMREASHTSNQMNAMKNPSEMFACTGSDYAHSYILHPTETTLFRKVIDWFSNLVKKLGNKEVDYTPVQHLFDKVMDDTKRSFWAGDDKMGADPAFVDFVNKMENTPIHNLADNMVLWHGTKSMFQKFMDKYILSGTGGTMRGHGHYLTSTEEVGRYYKDLFKNSLKLRDGLTEADLDIMLRRIQSDPQVIASDIPIFHEMQKPYKTISQKADMLRRFIQENSGDPTFLQDLIGNDYLKSNPTYLHKVEIPDDINLIDLDRPISKAQAYTIADALRRELDTDLKADTKKISFVQDLIHKLETDQTPLGDDIQNNMISLFGKKGASDFFRDECGINGNTYIGESSGVRNYVIFDENIPKIISSETFDMLGMQQMYDRAKAFIDNLKPYKDTAGIKLSDELRGGPGEEARIKEIQTNPQSADSIKFFQQLFQNPMSMFKGTKVEPYWFNLNGAELKYSFKHDQNRMTITDAFRGLSKEEVLNVRKVMEKKIIGNVNEQAAAQKATAYFEAMKGRIKNFLLDDFRRGLNDNEYNAVMDMVAGKDPYSVKKKYPAIDIKTLEELKKNYDAIGKWGLDDYIPNYEFGRIKIMTNTPEGYKLVSMGLSKRDAVRKAVKYLKDNPDFNGDLFIDTSAPRMFDDKYAVTRDQYHAMANQFKKKMEEVMTDVSAGIRAELARAAMKRQFSMKPTDVFAPYLKERKGLLHGEDDIQRVLNHYSYIMEKKMALDPVIDDIRQAINSGEFDKSEARAITEIVEAVKGKYWAEDRALDSMIKWMGEKVAKITGKDFDINPHGTVSAYSRRARMIEANLKLGYRPGAALVNLISGQSHVWTKVGTKAYFEAAKFLRTEEGLKFVREIEPYLGTSVVEITSGIKSKIPMTSPLGLFQKPEPLNRKMSAAATYLMEKAAGTSEGAAFQAALKATWMQQFCYNMSSLPKFMRSPGARMLTQFMPYVTNELAFIRGILHSPTEMMRYLSWNLALGGPRGVIMTLRTLPILAMFPAFQEVMDTAEGWLNANAPEWARGIPGLINKAVPGTGFDVSGPASFQFPTAMPFGPHVASMIHVFKDFIGSTFEHGPWIPGKQSGALIDWRTGLAGIAPAIKEWMKIVDYVEDPGHHVLNTKLESLRKVPNLPDPQAIIFLAQKGLSLEGIEESQARVAMRIGENLAKRVEDQKKHLTNVAAFDMLQGRPLDDQTVALMVRLKANPEGAIDKTILNNVPVQYRPFFKKELETAFEMYKLHPQGGEQESYD